MHFNPEDEDDDFAAATTANDSDNADAHSSDEAVEEEEEGEPSEPQVSRASLNYHFEKQDTPTFVISTGSPKYSGF